MGNITPIWMKSNTNRQFTDSILEAKSLNNIMSLMGPDYDIKTAYPFSLTEFKCGEYKIG
jgi:hypothetical protein